MRVQSIYKQMCKMFPRSPLDDITNGYQPTSVDLDEKKEQIKARRRAAYRKKKEEATIKKDENLPAL